MSGEGRSPPAWLLSPSPSYSPAGGSGHSAPASGLPWWGGGPSRWLVDPLPRFTCHPPALGDTRPPADQTMASRHCQPKAGGSSHARPNQERETALLLRIVEEAELDALKAHRTILFDPRSAFDKVKIQVSGFSCKTGLSGHSRLPGLAFSRHRLVQRASNGHTPRRYPH